MNLLYVDDSGLEIDKGCDHCVLAGFAIRENETYFAQKTIDDIVEKHLGTSNVELHGTHMRGGRKEWRKVPRPVRENLIKSVLNNVAVNYPRHYILFGVVLNKKAYHGDSVSKELFTQITSRFDMFLKRKHHRNNEHEKGIAIFDKSTSEQQYQAWSQTFQSTGNRWGNTLVNFAEVPLFLDSKMSRLIQVADILAYSLFRKYEYNDDEYFSIIRNCFDRDTMTGDVHGLYVQ